MQARYNYVWHSLALLTIAFGTAVAESKATALDALHAAILDDVIEAYVGHEPSICGVTSSSPSTSYSFEFPGGNAASEWYEDFVPYEEELFRAIMSFDDDGTQSQSGDKSWSIRIGTGGNIYSHYAPDMWGETLPPQRHGTKENGKGKAPWVDEVYQSVAVNTKLNQINREYDHPQYCEGDPTLPENNPGYGKCKKMYVHQAGGYTLDPPFTDERPFYSPSLASRCEGNTCTFAGWGTSAHLATPFTSSIIYFNRYTNCGDGVIEHTQVIHNMADPLDPASTGEGGLNVDYDFFNVPWAGVRPSNLPYALEPDGATDSISFDAPNNVDFLYQCRFGGTNIYGDPGHDSKPSSQPAWRGMSEDLKNTGGYTTFVEYGLLVNETAPFEMPCRDNGGPTCFEDKGQCMASSCTDEQVQSGAFTRMQLKVAPDSSPGCTEHAPKYDNTYNKYAVLQCNMRDTGFGKNTGFVSDDVFTCTPWVLLKFVNTVTGEALDVPYVRHFSWSPNDRIVYFGVNEMDTTTAIDMVNGMFDNTGNPDELLIDVRTFHGAIDAVPANYNPSNLKAFTYVYGRGEDFDGPGSIGGRVQRRVGTTETLPHTRDYSVFTVRWFAFGARLPPGQTFNFRIYNFVGDLDSATEKADELLPGVFSTDIDPEQWSPRKVDVYQSGNYFASVAASSAGGDTTECEERTAVCSGTSTPTVRHIPHFYITCGESTYFGKNPYHFAPSFGAEYPAHGTADNPVRSYVCDGQDTSIRPTWKLMGFFPVEDLGCASLETAKYDESFFECSATEPPTETPTTTPSDPPTASPTTTSTTSAPSNPPTASPILTGTTPAPFDPPTASPMIAITTPAPSNEPIRNQSPPMPTEAPVNPGRGNPPNTATAKPSRKHTPALALSTKAKKSKKAKHKKGPSFGPKPASAKADKSNKSEKNSKDEKLTVRTRVHVAAVVWSD